MEFLIVTIAYGPRAGCFIASVLRKAEVTDYCRNEGGLAFDAVLYFIVHGP
jgi:hypothetical protein